MSHIDKLSRHILYFSRNCKYSPRSPRIDRTKSSLDYSQCRLSSYSTNIVATPDKLRRGHPLRRQLLGSALRPANCTNNHTLAFVCMIHQKSRDCHVGGEIATVGWSNYDCHQSQAGDPLLDRTWSVSIVCTLNTVRALQRESRDPYLPHLTGKELAHAHEKDLQ